MYGYFEFPDIFGQRYIHLDEALLPMVYWAEILRSFDNPDKLKEAKHRQAAATLVLMYLALGKDYPYHMAKIFKAVLSDANKGGFGILKNEGKIASFLADMEKKKLLIRLPQRIVLGRFRKYYGINPKMAQTYKDDQADLHIPDQLFEGFLDWFERSNSSEDRRKKLIIEWSSIEELDFGTLLLFLQIAALEWESSSISTKDDSKILLQFLENYLDILEMEDMTNLTCAIREEQIQKSQTERERYLMLYPFANIKKRSYDTKDD